MKIMEESHNYKIGKVPVGELLFKLMIKKSFINMRPMSTVMRNNLSFLDTYMSTVNLDVSIFNQYVKLNLTRLQACGDNSYDLMFNLF